MNDGAVVLLHVPAPSSSQCRFRCGQWETRCTELAASLRRSNQDLLETTEALAECRRKLDQVTGLDEGHVDAKQIQALAAQEQVLRQRHGQEMAMRLEMQ